MVNIHEPGPFEGRADQWPVLATTGAMEVRLAETDAEVEAAQHLRYRVFYEEMSAVPSPEMRFARRDFDRFDEFCDHLLVIDRAAVDDEGQPKVVGTYRMIPRGLCGQGGRLLQPRPNTTCRRCSGPGRPARAISSSAAPAS